MNREAIEHIPRSIIGAIIVATVVTAINQWSAIFSAPGSVNIVSILLTYAVLIAASIYFVVSENSASPLHQDDDIDSFEEHSENIEGLVSNLTESG